jgi:hypothetical protein
MTSKERSFLVMLKVMYTEAGLHLECLTQMAEEWVALQATLAMRTGQKLVMEHCSASLLLRRNLKQLQALERLIGEEGGALGVCDAEFVEVSLRGCWVTFGQEEEGTFVAVLSDAAEGLVFQLWRESQVESAPIWHR